jgi:hypothetical protein
MVLVMKITTVMTVIDKNYSFRSKSQLFCFETSNNSARDAQALLRSSQEQQLQHSRMLPPTIYPSGTGGIISDTPFVPTLSTPSTGLRTRELHRPGYYHVGSPADQGYAEQMRAIYSREDVPKQTWPECSCIPRQSYYPNSQD